MKTHLTIIGAVNIAFGIMGIFLGLICIVVLCGFLPIDFGDFPAKTIGSVVGTIIILFSITFIIAGAGVMREASWARILTLILSAMAIFFFPCGTAWAIYSIWALVNSETVEIFSKETPEQPEPVKPMAEEKEPEKPAAEKKEEVRPAVEEKEEKKEEVKLAVEEKKKDKKEKKKEENTRGPASYS